MTRFQIIGFRTQIRNNAGAVLAGGSIIVRAAGTTRPVETSSDAIGENPNPNPVPISGSGRCSIWVDQPVDIVVRDNNGATVFTESNLNPANVVQGFDSGLIDNGGFERDSNSDGVPDGWTSENNASGSNNGLETSALNVASGTQSWRTQSNGSGGGELVTDRFDVNDVDNIIVRFRRRSTVSSVRNIVRVEWSDVTDTPISNTIVLDSSSNPSVFTDTVATATPPSGARLARVRILGGTTGGTGAGITYWDNFRVELPAVFTGAFGNLLISGNTLSSTNTDGDIDLDPTGAGVINLRAATNIIGATNLTGNLTVTGLTTTSTLVVSSVTTLTSTLNALGNVAVTGTLGVTGATTLTSLTATNGVFSGLLRSNSNDVVDLTDSNAPFAVAPLTGQHLEFDGQRIQGKANATTNGLLQLNILGGTVTVGGTTGQDITLRNLRTVVNAGQAEALVVQNRTDGGPAVGAVQNVFMKIANSLDIDVGQVGFVSSSSMVVRSLNHGASVFLDGEDAGGVLRTIFRGDPDGNSQMAHAGTTNLQTQSISASDAVTGAQVRRRDGILVGVGPDRMRILTVTTNHTIGIDDVGRFLRRTTSGIWSITFPNDANIPVGATGLIHNRRGITATVAPASGVTLTFENGAAAGSIAANSINRWVKIGLTAFTIYQVS